MRELDNLCENSKLSQDSWCNVNYFCSIFFYIFTRASVCALSAHTQKCLSYKPKLVAESHTHKLPHCHIFQVLSSSRTFSSITAAWIAICLKLAKNSFNIFLLVFLEFWWYNARCAWGNVDPSLVK